MVEKKKTWTETLAGRLDAKLDTNNRKLAERLERVAENLKRPGRPITEGREGEKSTLGIRASATLKARLQEAAEHNGRSLSAEAEIRLEQSFRDDDLLPQLMATAYGERLAAVLMMIGAAMSDTGRHAGFTATYTLEGSTDWINHPWAFEQAAKAAEHVLGAIAPEGNVEEPKSAKHALGSHLANLGVGFANGFLNSVAGRGATETQRRWAEPVQKLLGRDLVKLIKQRMVS